MSVMDAKLIANFNQHIRKLESQLRQAREIAFDAAVRNVVLEELLEEFCDHYMDQHDYGSRCVHCGGRYVGPAGQPYVKHATDCPVTRARALLGDA